MTARSKPRFTIKESASGAPWIAIEYRASEPGIPSGMFGFELPDGTDLAEANGIAEFLNDKLTHFTYTA